MALPKPVSRADMYLSYLNYTKGLTLANLPKPVSRADMYLYNLCINRGIGGGSGGSNVTLNGEPQTNFNFIENKVVQDELVVYDNTMAQNINIGDTLSKEYYDMTFYFLVKTNIPVNKMFFNLKDGEGGFTVQTNGDNKGIVINLRGVDGVANYKYIYNVDLSKINVVRFVRNGSKLRIYFNGEFKHTVIDGIDCMISTPRKHIGVVVDALEKSEVLVYDRILTPQEVQHNLSVLNNSPSIKELHTTDSTGKTSILKLASDTDHVEDRSGRTQEQINRTFYKRMCKEIPSPSGEPITVENGEEGYVLSAEIKGQTVKNEITDIEMLTTTQWETTTRIEYISDGWFRAHRNGSDTFVGRKTTTINVSDLKNMTLIMEIRKNTLTSDCVLSGGRFGKAPKAGEAGIFKIPYNAIASDTHFNYFVLKGDGEIEFRYTLIKNENVSSVTEGFVGLSSTEAIISNNGKQYPIYASEEDKANKKVILLAKVGDIVDSLTVSEEGNGIYTRYLNKILFDGSEPWQLVEDREKTLRFNYINTSAGVYLNGVGALDKVPFGNPRSGDVEGFSCLNNAFCISVLKDKLETHDLNGFKTWLSINIPKGIYQLATPVITHIPKELVPTILTQQTNILEVGGAVKPSSFKVTVPVDRLAEIEARLQALESTTVDVVLNK